MAKGYYMVRAMGSQPHEFDVFFKNNVVAIGWSDIDVFKLAVDISKLKELVVLKYYSDKDWNKSTVTKNLNEIERFVNIREGDYIVIPYWNSIRLAIASGKQNYSQEDIEVDLANQTKVEFLKDNEGFKTIPRKALSESLQRRLRVPGSTVTDLTEFSEEIDKLFLKSNYSWTTEIEEREQKQLEIIKQQLLRNIQNGNTNLASGGQGFEKLIVELFECEGYEAKLLSKNKFRGKGDADVSASKFDRFNEVKVLAQVKHHKGYTDNWGIDQLNEIKNNTDEYNEYQFVLITSGFLNDSVKEYGLKLNIDIIDGDELVNWIMEYIYELSPNTRYKLGFSNYPSLL